MKPIRLVLIFLVLALPAFSGCIQPQDEARLVVSWDYVFPLMEGTGFPYPEEDLEGWETILRDSAESGLLCEREASPHVLELIDRLMFRDAVMWMIRECVPGPEDVPPPAEDRDEDIERVRTRISRLDQKIERMNQTLAKTVPFQSIVDVEMAGVAMWLGGTAHGFRLSVGRMFSNYSEQAPSVQDETLRESIYLSLGASETHALGVQKLYDAWFGNSDAAGRCEVVLPEGYGEEILGRFEAVKTRVYESPWGANHSISLGLNLIRAFQRNAENAVDHGRAPLLISVESLLGMYEAYAESLQDRHVSLPSYEESIRYSEWAINHTRTIWGDGYLSIPEAKGAYDWERSPADALLHRSHQDLGWAHAERVQCDGDPAGSTVGL